MHQILLLVQKSKRCLPVDNAFHILSQYWGFHVMHHGRLGDSENMALSTFALNISFKCTYAVVDRGDREMRRG